MSRCGNSPWEHRTTRQAAKRIRRDLVHQAGCCNRDCLSHAVPAEEWLEVMPLRWVRIPRSFRKPLDCLERRPSIVVIVDVPIGELLP